MMDNSQRQGFEKTSIRVVELAREIAAQRSCFASEVASLAELHTRAVRFLAQQQEENQREVIGAIESLALVQRELASQKQVRQGKKRWEALRDSLMFPTMHDRQQAIESPHRQTYEWIFEPDMGKGADLDWAPFADWARSSVDLYWISGRAAAGKSTMMAFLYDHSDTKSLLRNWATPSTLVSAGYFFNAEGSSMQKSRSGLLRTLLYRCLCSDAMAQHLPAVIGPAASESAVSQPWSESMLREAFARMTGTAGIRFCLFIDALDELEGEDVDGLLELLSEITEGQNVKACISSRPWLVFQQAFDHVPQLRLEELTSADMRVYIKDKLLVNDRFNYLQPIEQREMEDFIDAMVQQAEGVFLWIKLAVPSLLRGFRTEDEIEVLQQRLQYLPKGLRGLYAHMLEALEPFHFARASRFFRLCLAATTPPSVLTLALAETVSLDYVLQQSPQSHGIDQFQHTIRRTSKRIYSHGAGLLEIDALPLNRDPLNIRTMFAVGFGPVNEQLQPMHRPRASTLHRTVREFLHDETNPTAKKLLAETRGFEPGIALLAAAVLQVKLAVPDKHLLFRLVLDILSYCRNVPVQLQSQMVALIDELDMTMREKQGTYEPYAQLKTVHWSNAFYLGRFSGPVQLPPVQNRSMLDFALACGLTAYARDKLEFLPLDTPTEEWTALLHHTIKSADAIFSPYTSVMLGPQPALLESVLKHGADPNAPIHDTTSSWQHWLSRLFFGPIRNEHDYPRIMELMLSHGADPDAPVQVSREVVTPTELVTSRADALSKELRCAMLGLLEQYGASGHSEEPNDTSSGAQEPVAIP